MPLRILAVPEALRILRQMKATRPHLLEKMPLEILDRFEQIKENINQRKLLSDLNETVKDSYSFVVNAGIARINNEFLDNFSATDEEVSNAKYLAVASIGLLALHLELVRNIHGTAKERNT